MFARVVTFHRAQPNGIDAANTLAREQVLPLLHEQPGYQGTLVLADRATGKQLGISLWDTAEHAAGSPSFNAARGQSSKQLGDTMPPVTEVFEVSLSELPSTIAAATDAVITG